MRPGTVFYKTEKGQRELDQRRGALALRDRRVLMLVNGQRSIEEIGDLAANLRVDDFSSVLQRLVDNGFATYPGAPQPVAAAASAGPAAATPDRTAPVENTSADPSLDEPREFMLTTLKAFTNPRRVAGLVRSITDASSEQDIRRCLEPWYDAISETPEGIFRADELRARLLEQLLHADKRVF